MTDWPASKVVDRKVADLVPNARNSRTHSKAQVQKIVASIREFGWTNPVLVDEKGVLIAGHGRILAAEMMGIDKVPAMVATGWSDEQKRAYMIADNRLALDAGWDKDILAAEFAELADAGFDLALTGFDLAEIKGLTTDAGGESNQDDDEPPEARELAISQEGDVWLLGPHRLVVGDCFANVKKATNGEQVHLIATDPPYAIYGSSTGVASDIADDTMVVPFFEKILTMAHDQLPWFGHAYLCCDWRSWSAIQRAAKTAAMDAKNLLVWDKGQGLGNNYANCFELIGFFAKLPPQTAMGDRKGGQRPVLRPNVLRINKVPPKQKEHNAAKPVALMEELITNSSEPGQLVLEPFAGSGTTLIACEKLGRVCAASEHNPRFADIVVRRWQKFTNKKAKHEKSKKTFDTIEKQRTEPDA